MLGKNLNLPVSPSSDHQAYKDDLQRSGMTRNGVFAAISYMASAVLLVMFNKAALSSYRYPCANVITLFQIISFTTGASPQSTGNDPIALLPLETLAHTLPLAISYLLYMLVSMESIRGVNVPMYTTIRRTTVAFTMVMEYFLAGQTHSPSVVGSVGTIILGTIIAGAGDLSFDSYSYAVVFMSNLCTAVYLAFIARIGKSSGLSSFGLMWCNGIICMPILLLWTFVSGDLEVTANFSYLLSPGFQAVMVLSCILAFFLNYFIFLNTTLNSALTQTICGNLKHYVVCHGMGYCRCACELPTIKSVEDLFTIGMGWLLFGGLPFDPLNLVGQSLGFIGSCLYAYCKIKGK